MDLNLFENLKKDLTSNTTIKNFMEDLSNFLTNLSSKTQKNENETSLNNNLEEYRKEGHLYLVTEDRNNKVYLWDFTDKPEYEIEETEFPQELLDIAKEGTMFQFKNGTYELYSENGYDMLFDEENNK